MKIEKGTGSVKLGKNDVRVGNFVLTLQDGGEVRLRDIAGLVDLKLGAQSIMARCVPVILEGGNTRYCEMWADTLYFMLSVLPDAEMMTALVAAGEACVKRHAEMYGGAAGEVSDREQKRILKEQRELREGLPTE